MGVTNLGDLLANSRKERTNKEGQYQDIVQHLRDALKDGEAEVRAAAAKALGSIGDTRTIEDLKEALKDESAEVRAAAVEALGKIGATMKHTIEVNANL
ncbi:MAG: HEAT repeat domain-containing protein [Anaerolineales bacterium]|nr:HEAT repeat domain-containing protein [Anaerolineales bacterium]